MTTLYRLRHYHGNSSHDMTNSWGFPPGTLDDVRRMWLREMQVDTARGVVADNPVYASVLLARIPHWPVGEPLTVHYATPLVSTTFIIEEDN